MIELLLDRDSNIEITETIVVAAAKNKYGKDMMELLLHRDPNIEITEAVVVAAAGDGIGVMKLLLDRNPNIKITKAVVVAAVGHYSGTNMIKMLLNQDPNIEITEEVMTAAVVGNSRKPYGRAEMVEFLLDRNPNIEITETVLVVAARNENDANARKVMELMLDRDPNIEITETVVAAAAGNGDDETVMELLLARENIQITQAVAVAAVSNEDNGYEVMQLLLVTDRKLDITMSILTAAAENRRCRKGVIGLLARNSNIKIRDAGLKAIATFSILNTSELGFTFGGFLGLPCRGRFYVVGSCNEEFNRNIVATSLILSLIQTSADSGQVNTTGQKHGSVVYSNVAPVICFSSCADLF